MTCKDFNATLTVSNSEIQAYIMYYSLIKCVSGGGMIRRGDMLAFFNIV